MRERLVSRLRDLEGQPAAATDEFADNVSTLARLLGLNHTEREIAGLVLVMQIVPGLAALFRDLGPGGFAETSRLAAVAIGAREADVRAALRRDGPLRGPGLVAIDLQEPYGVSILPMSGLTDAMLSGRRSARAIMRLFVSDAPRTSLDIANFAHVTEDVRAIIRLLRGALRRRARGVNVLLHGAPGTGKTELTRVVAQTLGAKLFQVADSNAEGDATPGRERLSACALAQRTLARTRRSLLVFDEVEDAFVRWGGTLGLVREAGGTKAWTNRMMESTSVPTFWVANEIGHIDMATLRRFDLVVELRVPPTGVRMSMLRDALGETQVDPALLNRLAADQRITPAHVSRAVRATRLMNARTEKDVTATLSHVLALLSQIGTC